MNRRNFLAASAKAAIALPFAGKLVEVAQPEATTTVTINLEQSPVVAGARKLKAVWSIEGDQLLQRWHNARAEEVLARALQNPTEFCDRVSVS